MSRTVQPTQSGSAYQATVPTPPAAGGTTTPVAKPPASGNPAGNNPSGAPITAQPTVNVPASQDKGS